MLLIKVMENEEKTTFKLKLHYGIRCGIRLQLYGTVQCSGFWMIIPDLDFYPSRIPDPATATEEEGKKSVVLPYLFL